MGIIVSQYKDPNKPINILNVISEFGGLTEGFAGLTKRFAGLTVTFQNIKVWLISWVLFWSKKNRSFISRDPWGSTEPSC